MTSVVSALLALHLAPISRVKSLLKPAILHIPEVTSFRRYYREFGRYPNVLSPKTFNEKLQARKIFDRRKIHILWADKVAARDYVQAIAGAELLPKLHYLTDDPHSIPFHLLPERYVVKPSHGSGWVRLVKNGSSVDRNAIVEECTNWLSRNYFYEHQERIYKNVKRQIMVEEFLEDAEGEVPEDFKFYTFDGTVRFIQIDVARFGAHRRNIYDRNWNLLPVRLTVQNCNGTIARPSLLDEMVECAERLSGGIDFVRVDLYRTRSGIRFGEMTPSSGNGYNRFTPNCYDEVFGQYWNLRW